MSELIKTTVHEVTDNFNNIRVPLSAKQRENIKKIYPYYGAQSIIDYVDNYLFDGEYILIAEDGENLRSQNSNVCNLVNGKFWVNNHAHIIKGKGGNSTKYLFYLLNLIDYKPFVTGSAQPKLTKDNLNSIPLKIHSVKDQQKIAKVLSDLDAKIALNNKINAELEAMAKLIYDYWFVQFDFPISKEQAEAMGKPELEGRGYKSSGGKMVWNAELRREVPEGGECKTLGELVNIKNGRDHKHLGIGEIPVYGSGGVMRYADKSLYEGESILIPRKGSLGNLFYINQPFWCVDTIFYTQMKYNQSCKFLFYTTQNFNLATMNTGTSVPSMTTQILNNLQLVFPPLGLLKEFDEVLTPIYKKRDLLKVENQKLAELRDWLLPMLMNGQVTVEAYNEQGKQISMAAEAEQNYSNSKK